MRSGSSRRTAGAVEGLDALLPGDHVCWVVSPGIEYEPLTRRCAEAGSATNDKVLAFGPQHTLTWTTDNRHAAVVGIDPRVAFLDGGPLAPDTMFEAFRRETAAAQREGYRGLRVVADMDWLLARKPASDDLLAFELRLDELVADLDATVVCAYRSATFDDDDIARMVSVHPHDLDADDDLGFRMWYGDDSTWVVSGEIDFSNADAFGVALAAVAEPGTLLRLRFDDLVFADVAAMRAIATVAEAAPGLWLRFEGARATFRRAWSMLQYAERLPTVEVV